MGGTSCSFNHVTCLHRVPAICEMQTRPGRTIIYTCCNAPCQACTFGFMMPTTSQQDKWIQEHHSERQNGQLPARVEGHDHATNKKHNVRNEVIHEHCQRLACITTHRKTT
eukprot:2187039-Amphidinium_carterae.1